MGYSASTDARGRILNEVWGVLEEGGGGRPVEDEGGEGHSPSAPSLQPTALEEEVAVHGREPGGLYSDMPVLLDATVMPPCLHIVKDPQGISHNLIMVGKGWSTPI